MSDRWTSSVNHAGQRLWRRPMGIGESSFYWDSALNGTFDILFHYQLELDRSHLDVMEPDNIRSAWITLKTHFPMVASNFVREGDGDEVYYEIAEERIHSIAPEELDIVGSISSKDEASAIVEQFLSGPRQLRSDMNAKLIIRSEIFEDETEQSRSAPAHFHFFILASHAVSDSGANASLFTTFASMLTAPCRRLPRASIKERLAMIPDGETIPHNPAHSVARRRWRKAIASVLLQARAAKTKGGQLLPNKIQLKTFFESPKSESYRVSLDLEGSDAVLKSCRAQGITFGSAVMPLCQIAQARIIHRRRQTMPPEEWESRIREPMHYNGPISLRARMPEEWKKKGGMTEFFMLIGVYECTLPRMPSCDGSGDLQYDELLSRASFRNRCLSVQRQTTEYVSHPLFHELSSALYVGRLENRRKAAQLWEKNQRGEVAQQDLEEFARYVGSFPSMLTSSASSIGSMERAIAKDYPLPSDGEIPFLKVYGVDPYVRALGGLIYLAVMGNFGRLWIYCWFDGNSYDVDLIKEWVDEVAKAAEFYLGGDKDKGESAVMNS